MNSLIEAIVGDITNPKTEAIVNPANGVGIMGKGVAGAITARGGSSISRKSKELVEEQGKPFEPGEVYVTDSGRLVRRGVQKVYHAVTMKFPGGLTSLDTVNRAMRSLLELAIKDGIKSIAIPGLGTGIGRLDKGIVASAMVQVAKNYDHLIKIKIIDHNEVFIGEIKKLLGNEDE